MFQYGTWEHSERKDIQKMWGHTAVQMNQHIYIIGGHSNSFNKQQILIFKYNCHYNKFDIIPNKYHLPSRNSHASVLIDNKIYIWGGNISNQLTDQLWEYSQQDNLTKIKQDGIIPEKRQGHGLIQLKNRWMLLYGGNQQNKIFQDFHIFDTKQMRWRQIDKIQGSKICKRQNFTMTRVGQYVYIFGGHGLQNDKEVFLNDLYRLQINGLQHKSCYYPPSLLIFKIPYYTEDVPPQRSMHTSIPYQDKYLFILGGQGYQFQQTQKINYIIDQDFQPHILNDLWYYCTETYKWKKVKIVGNSLNRINCTGSFYKNKLYIYGGMESLSNASSKLSIFTFIDRKEDQIKIVQKNVGKTLCQNCQIQHGLFKQQDIKVGNVNKKLFQYSFKPNSDTIHQYSYTLHPFSALCLLIDQILSIEALKINISLNQNPHYLKISYDQIFWRKEELLLIFSRQIDSVRMKQQQISIMLQGFGNSLYIGCSRLGQQFIYVINLNNELIIMYFKLKAKSRIQKYLYCQNSNLPSNIKPQFLIIKRQLNIILKKICLSVQQLQQKKVCSQIYIFGLAKQYKHYQLKLQNRDIVSNNESLSQFICNYFFMVQIGRHIYINSKLLQIYDVSSYMQEQQNRNRIKQVNLNSVSNKMRIKIYKILIPDKYGQIKILYKNKFINYLKYNTKQKQLILSRYTGYVIMYDYNSILQKLVHYKLTQSLYALQNKK